MNQAIKTYSKPSVEVMDVTWNQAVAAGSGILRPIIFDFDNCTCGCMSGDTGAGCACSPAGGM